MSMVDMHPMEVSVSCDRMTGRPRSVRVSGPTRSASSPWNASATSRPRIPAHEGPRTVFVVRTARARIRLAFRHRERRWLMEGIDPLRAELPAAA